MGLYLSSYGPVWLFWSRVRLKWVIGQNTTKIGYNIFPVGLFGYMFVKNNWWGVWPSCQMMKKCCRPIWALTSGKRFRPKKNNFPKFGFCTVIFCFVKKNTNIQIVTHPFLDRLFKNVMEILHDHIANLAWYRKWVFFSDLGPKNHPSLIPSGAIWANVHEKWLMGRLTVLPNDEKMLLTDLSSKVRKNV